jgi:hypothetical protein
MLRTVAASGFVHDPSGRGRVGKPIQRGDKLILRTNKDGNPMFRPHPDCVVPSHWLAENNRRDLEEVRKTARDMDVQVEGTLLLPFVVVEMWSQESILWDKLCGRWLEGDRFSWEVGAADPEWDMFL